MNLSELKNTLQSCESLTFKLPNGTNVPAHFHLTELGKTSRKFIDCGGTYREEANASMQLWVAEDVEHRLSAEKWIGIIDMGMDKLELGDEEIEIEYQSDTIGRYKLGFENGVFQLMATQTDCLAKEKCGIPEKKEKLSLSSIGVKTETACTPGSGCC